MSLGKAGTTHREISNVSDSQAAVLLQKDNFSKTIDDTAQ
jgi:hypothetical protein